MKNVNRTFNRLITIEKRTISKDEMNQEIESWEHFADIWVEVNSLYGKEYYSAKTVNEENTLVFKCRYNDLFKLINTIDYRIIFDHTVLDIEHIDNMMYENNIVKIKALERGINED